MTPRYELAAPAERDLEEIFFEVNERHGRLAAERLYENLLRSQRAGTCNTAWSRPP